MAAVCRRCRPLVTITVPPEVERMVRIGARALDRAGLVHAYGHVSHRLGDDRFLVCAAKPMRTIGADDAGTIVPIDGALPDGVLGEVRIHQSIYRVREDVNAVCRVMPPTVVALSVLRVTPRPRHGFGAFFAPAPPLFDDAQLIRDQPRADGLAAMLAGNPAIVMRANGAVTVGASMPAAVAFAWFLEEAARVEHVALLHRADADLGLSLEEVDARRKLDGRVIERMWEYLSHGDEEL